MRMRDSDDYLTARAANPRTGLVSPSVGCRTPMTPGEALRIFAESPTPESKVERAVRPAGAERKTSGSRWRQDEKGWFTAPVVASPRTTSTPPELVNEDAFVVHMPSAAELQPYTYPGRSADQIEKFEHYRCEARKGSTEGDGSKAVINEDGPRRFAQAQQALRSCSGNATRREVTNDKREATDHTALKTQPKPFADALTASTFAPFVSPRTSRNRSSEALQTAMKTMPGAFGCDSALSGIARKPVGSGPITTPLSQITQQRTSTKDCSPAGTMMYTDLRQLPRVRLVHPELASLPGVVAGSRDEFLHGRHGIVVPAKRQRECSLGCRQVEGSECVEGPSVPFQYPPLFEATPQLSVVSASVPEAPQDSWLQLATNLLKRTCSVTIPKTGLAPLDVLSTPTASSQEKVDALKSLLALGGQAIALLTVATVLYRIGSVAWGVLETLLLPIKLLRWLLGGS